jgi:DnaJ homolog subfamily B member 12
LAYVILLFLFLDHHVDQVEEACPMEGNRDEALRCLAIAQRHKDAGNYPSARKFCQKSINLFSTPEALKLLASINSGEKSAEPSSSTFASAAETHPSASGAKHRHTTSSATGNGTPGGIGGEKRDYTPEQRNVVKRVRACKVTEYYEILSVKKECEEAEVKKAYRKVIALFSFSKLLLSTHFRHSHP